MPQAASWDDFRLVKAIADAHSLVGASESLGLNHSTLFRRLGALEKALGVRLFDRSRLGYAPTAAGEEMIALARRMAEEITEFERTMAGRDIAPAGELRVTTNDTFLAYFLGPILVSFSRAYPQIQLDIIVGDAALNLSRRDADVAIRASGDPPETLVGRRIGAVNWARYARATPDATLDPDALGWIGFGGALTGVRAARWLAETIPQQRILCRVDSILGMVNLIAAGLGLGILPCFIGDSTPGLVRFGERLPDLGDAIWLLTHADLKNAARVRAFMDHAGTELMRCRKTLEGD